ncbi:receptor kinase-like protein Xa21 [Ziziphus jujuba]|uniref:Receptor kinase-like protein Xa21 n=1 Tax=Ziziphus jujuba TaxID=326968 RepID=A0ABM3IQ04_ZIZJJ|nr:receptor kinase-like protein Xa21 [Ziziphus jujuba]
MPNGSLEKWLYNQRHNCLDILTRMDLMIDVASGMEYLHHGYSELIVHCDLKPSNVLLYEDMVAHVGDFGIAKILAKYKSMTRTTTLGITGYIAPCNFLLDEDMVAHVGDFGIAKFLAKYKSMTRTTTLGTTGYIAPCTIPSSVFNISSLRYVALTSNGIFGSIPTDMCHRLPNLEAFYLPDNPIRGHIRASLCLCRNLKQLGLGKVGFAGTIPKCLGEISSELGKLSNLRMLNLQYNKLSGRLPPTFCSLNSSIERIYVSKNLLRGHISDLCLCKKLREVVLDHNGFAGSIPRCLSNLSHLELLDLKNNNLSGEISSELGQLSNLTVLDLQSNNLSGSLPPTIFNHSLTVNVPKITGFQLPMLREVYSSLNRLSGRIPDSISNASMLIILELATNFFSGPVLMTFDKFARK